MTLDKYLSLVIEKLENLNKEINKMATDTPYQLCGTSDGTRKSGIEFSLPVVPSKDDNDLILDFKQDQTYLKFTIYKDYKKESTQKEKAAIDKSVTRIPIATAQDRYKI